MSLIGNGFRQRWRDSHLFWGLRKDEASRTPNGQEIWRDTGVDVIWHHVRHEHVFEKVSCLEDS